MSENLIDILFSDEEQEGTTSIISNWLKSVGDSVEQFEAICEVSTDKAIVEITAPEAGILREIIAAENSEIEPGQLVAKLEPGEASSTGASKADDSSPKEKKTKTEQVQIEGAHRSIQRFAEAKGVNISDKKGSGSLGQFRSSDVGASGRAAGNAALSYPETAAPSHEVPHDAMRLQIARNMSESLLNVAPHVTAVFECDMRAVQKHRAENKGSYEAEGLKLTYTSYFLKAMLRAVALVPEVNSRWQEEHLQVFDQVNLGIGTALEDKGLLLPVLKAADKLNFSELVRATHELVEKARTGKLSKEDTRDATISISNHGVMGSLFAAPIIIPQPQSAIVGIGKLETRVKASDTGEFEAVPSCYITMTIDHRVLDAFHTNRFLGEMKRVLEAPEELMS